MKRPLKELPSLPDLVRKELATGLHLSTHELFARIDSADVVEAVSKVIYQLRKQGDVCGSDAPSPHHQDARSRPRWRLVEASVSPEPGPEPAEAEADVEPAGNPEPDQAEAEVEPVGNPEMYKAEIGFEPTENPGFVKPVWAKIHWVSEELKEDSDFLEILDDNVKGAERALDRYLSLLEDTVLDRLMDAADAAREAKQAYLSQERRV